MSESENEVADWGHAGTVQPLAVLINMKWNNAHDHAMASLSTYVIPVFTHAGGEDNGRDHADDGDELHPSPQSAGWHLSAGHGRPFLGLLTLCPNPNPENHYEPSVELRKRKLA